MKTFTCQWLLVRKRGRIISFRGIIELVFVSGCSQHPCLTEWFNCRMAVMWLVKKNRIADFWSRYSDHPNILLLLLVTRRKFCWGVFFYQFCTFFSIPSIFLCDTALGKRSQEFLVRPFPAMKKPSASHGYAHIFMLQVR